MVTPCSIAAIVFTLSSVRFGWCLLVGRAMSTDPLLPSVSAMTPRTTRLPRNHVIVVPTSLRMSSIRSRTRRLP
jgi:hypothetical protein